MSRDHTNDLSLEDIVDRCLDDVAIGGFSIDEALERWPDQRDEIEPLLEAAIAMRELPAVPQRAPDPDQRAALMSSIATTPQQRPRRAFSEAIGSWFAGLATAAPRIAAIAAPAAAIALVATLLTLGFVLSGGGDRASAGTLTLFQGAVEREQDGQWLPLADGATLEQGDHIRTLGDGQALLTFQDGSTAALAPRTELVIEQASMVGEGRVTLEQLGGRIWNDVAPSGDADTYVVRTPDAVIEAHGTTFETTVESGATDVVTASGIVEVAAGDERVALEPGQALRAIAHRIVTDAAPHPTSDSPATLLIEGPFVASLIAKNGSATGALPNGVVYQQIPGVSTTNPGDGPQVLRFFDIAPGRYELLIRRIEARRTDGGLVAGRVTFEANDRTQSARLPAGLDTMRIRIDIGVDGAIVSLALVDTDPVPVDQPDTTDQAERIVDSPRTTDAVSVSDQRATITRPTDASPTAPVEASPTPTATDTLTPRQRLQRALALEPPDRAVELRHLLESLGRDETTWANLRRLLESDATLRRALIDALPELDAPLFVDFVREQLALEAVDTPSDATTATPTDGSTRDSR